MLTTAPLAEISHMVTFKTCRDAAHNFAVTTLFLASHIEQKPISPVNKCTCAALQPLSMLNVKHACTIKFHKVNPACQHEAESPLSMHVLSSGVVQQTDISTPSLQKL